MRGEGKEGAAREGSDKGDGVNIKKNAERGLREGRRSECEGVKREGRVEGNGRG